MPLYKEEASETLYTPQEAAAYFKMGKRNAYLSVCRWAREGRIRAGKVGREWRFRRIDLDAFIFVRDRRRA